MTPSAWLGLVAGATTTVAFIPQVVRVYRLRSAREISLLFTVLSVIGIALWLLYGAVEGVAPLIYWNLIALVLFSALLYAKLKYGR